MAVYRPCFNCKIAKGTCARRDEIGEGIKGLGITSVKFTCPDRTPLYHAGQRVTVSWYVPCPEGYYDNGSLEAWPATVISEKAGKFIIAVDDVDSDHETPARSYIKSQNLFCKVSAGKLEPLDEPARPVCELCGELGPAYPSCWDDRSGRCPKAAAA